MTKILVAVWEPLIKGLNEKVKSACLKRDEFLDHVLRHEAQMLHKEVDNRNSDEARAYIATHLCMLRRKQVNLNLSNETVQAITEACEKVNVPRDAFINRVLLFLTADKVVFQRLLYEIDWDWAKMQVIENDYEGFDHIYDGSLSVIQVTVKSDPFQFYRACIEVTNNDGGEAGTLHDAFFSKDFFKGENAHESAIGFNCYVPDFLIEDQPESKNRMTQLEKLLMALNEEAGTSGEQKS